MSAPDTTLVLGSFTFQGLEVPGDIQGIGNAQRIGKHCLVGGGRVLDAMGVDYPPISWGGLFFGAGALDRMNALKALCAAGKPLTLTWHTFSYTVLVSSFDPDERRQFEIPYRIACEVVSDNSHFVDDGLPYAINTAMADGMSAAQLAAAVINDSILTTSIAKLQTTIDSIQDFASAAASVASLVQLAIQNCQSRVGLLLTLADVAIGAPSGFAGIGVGSDAVTMATTLTATQSAIFQESSLLVLNGTLGIIASNLANATGSPNILNVVGGNLFDIASQQYGDPSKWATIAKANGLVDPFLPNYPLALTIPLSPVDTGGVLAS